MPAFPLLASKLYPPPFRTNLVSRDRLTQKIEDGFRAGRKVTLVCAPAGFGKTTLVVDWLEHLRQTSQAGRAGQAYGWLGLEPTDNDPRLFLRYLLAALQTIQPGLGQTTQELLENPRLPALETLLSPLLNDLLAVPASFVLVLDDYHSIQEPLIHEMLAFLIERQPANMHTILTTRQDPLLPVARWRARGQLTELRLGELRFTQEEAAGFLNRTMRLNLTAEQVDTLEVRTEGWIAGLQMAAISLQQSETDGPVSTAAFIRDFAGDDRFIMDYLVDEVLSRQPLPVQEFLLKTSLLERFNLSLCRAVLAESPAEEGGLEDVFSYLEKANLFLIPLDNRRDWYRYHHLFAELLRHRLKSNQGRASEVVLQRRASLWFEQHELPDQAVHYAQAAADWELSARLITSSSPLFIRLGEVTTLLRWIRALPDAFVRRNAALSQVFGYALTQTGHLTSGKIYFDLAVAGFSGDPDQLGRTLVFASNNALFRGDYPLLIEQARKGLSLIDPSNTWIRGMAALSLGMGLLHTNQPLQAEQAFHEAFRAGDQAGSARTCINALDYLGRACVLRLDFSEAEANFSRAVQYTSGGKPLPGCDLPFFDLAMLKLEQNALGESAGFVEQGLEANQRSGSAEMLAYGLRIRARLCQLQGDPAGARENLELALRLSSQDDLSPLTHSLNAALQVEMALTDGDLRRAEMAAPRALNSLGLYTFISYPETARVHLLLVQERKQAALDLLQPVLNCAEQPGWEYPRLQMRVLQALAAADPRQASNYLIDALDLAIPARAARVFLDLGEPMRALLRERGLKVDNPSLRGYAQQLLAAFPAQAGPDPISRTCPSEELVEPLSERELEVLRLVGEGLSNTEIAAKLYLSPNTLKAHTQNIYAKLDVHSRVQAVNRARELMLL